MLCIDADGMVQRDFDRYLPQGADGCILSVDDCVSTSSACSATAPGWATLVRNARALLAPVSARARPTDTGVGLPSAPTHATASLQGSDATGRHQHWAYALQRDLS